MSEPEIVEATCTFSNDLEGHVKAGRLFAVGKPRDDLRVLTPARAGSLLKGGLVREYDPANKVALTDVPRPTYAGQPRTTLHQHMKNMIPKRPVRQEAAPKAPDPLKNPAGSQTGQEKSASSSAAAPVLPDSSLAVRGNRRSASSPSTTPTKSSPGQQPSTPATQTGGASTKDARRSGD